MNHSGHARTVLRNPLNDNKVQYSQHCCCLIQDDCLHTLSSVRGQDQLPYHLATYFVSASAIVIGLIPIWSQGHSSSFLDQEEFQNRSSIFIQVNLFLNLMCCVGTQATSLVAQPVAAMTVPGLPLPGFPISSTLLSD